MYVCNYVCIYNSIYNVYVCLCVNIHTHTHLLIYIYITIYSFMFLFPINFFSSRYSNTENYKLLDTYKIYFFTNQPNMYLYLL